MVYHAFFSHSNKHKKIVEEIAIYLEDNYNLKIWLDKWNLIPGSKWIQEIEKSLNETTCCVVFLGKDNSTAWYENEVELALNIESKNRDKYKIIPVLLPGADKLSESSFLSTRIFIDLREDIKNEEELYRLYCGIKGIEPGRFQKKIYDKTKEKLQKLQNYYNEGLIMQEVYVEITSEILKREFKL